MSYDLVVWTRRDPSGCVDLFAQSGFVSSSPGRWERVTKSWMIAISLAPVEDEDIPDEVFSRLRGLRFQTSLSVQPGTASASAIALARRVARELANACDGFWQDPQTGQSGQAKVAAKAPISPEPDATLAALAPRPGILARLFRRGADAAPQTPLPTAPKSDRSVTLLQMHWCLAWSDLLSKPGIEGFLDLLARHLPEALPRRYGPFEPPGFKYAEQGRAHFVDAYLADPGLVIYPTRPALGLYLPHAHVKHGMISGRLPYFAPVRVKIDLDAAILDDPVMAAHLPSVFKVLSQHLRPFYGEARCLSGYEAGKSGPVWVTRRAETSPLGNLWWQGVPRQVALARVIGAPYLDLWPDRSGWMDDAGLAFAMPPVWSASPVEVPVPDAIAQPLRPKGDDDAGYVLPPVFPFRQA